MAKRRNAWCKDPIWIGRAMSGSGWTACRASRLQTSNKNILRRCLISLSWTPSLYPHSSPNYFYCWITVVERALLVSRPQHSSRIDGHLPKSISSTKLLLTLSTLSIKIPFLSLSLSKDYEMNIYIYIIFVRNCSICLVFGGICNLERKLYRWSDLEWLLSKLFWYKWRKIR